MFTFNVVVGLVVFRYRNVNITYYKPHQVRHLYDSSDVEYINEIVRLSEEKSKRYGKISHSLLSHERFKFAIHLSICIEEQLGNGRSCVHLDVFFNQLFTVLQSVC